MTSAAAKCATLACTLTALAIADPARAQDIPGYGSIDEYDAREVKLLPQYCIHTQLFRDRVPGGADQQQIERWYAALGPTFWHTHHYCWGLMKTNRALLLARNEQARSAYLRFANVEFDYVIQRAQPGFVLLPEILTKKGENLVRLGNGPAAMPSFLRAIELKPDYWPPYAQMSDYYKSVGDTAKAREVLEKGLSSSPDAPALKRRLTDLQQGKASRTSSASQ